MRLRARRRRPEKWSAPFETLFQHARSLFVDEIFFTSPCERELVQNVLEQARINGVDLRVVPDMYNGLAWNSPIEYIGQFPTIPLHCGHVPEIGLLFKRVFDLLFSVLFLILFAPFLLIIAIAVKMDSPGPAFYKSERIGKKGRVFHCMKFRTMVDAGDHQRLHASLIHRLDIRLVRRLPAMDLLPLRRHRVRLAHTPDVVLLHQTHGSARLGSRHLEYCRGA